MNTPEPNIPRGLEEGIRSAYAAFPPGVTAEVDARMLGLAGVVRPVRRRGLRRVGMAAAAAAAVAAGVTVWVVMPQSRSGAVRPTPMAAVPAAASDLNHDGQVDMLDALALARQVESRTGTLDVNNDGRVDAADAQALAADAVRLERGTL